MTKYSFLGELLERLSALPEAAREKAYAFYAEIIDDSVEDGMTEEQAVAKLGSAEEIAAHIVSETPLSVLLKSRAKRGRNRRIPVLLWALGFPVWFPVLVSLASVLLSLFLVLWVLSAVLWVVFAACSAAAAGGVIGLFYIADTGARLMCIGSALVMTGFAALLLPASAAATKQVARLTRALWRKMKAGLFRKWRNA